MLKLLLLVAFSADPAQLIEIHPPNATEQQKELMDKTINHFSFWSKNFTNPKIYQNFKFGKRKFSDLSEFEKDMFYIIQGKEITVQVANIHRMALDKTMTETMQGVSNPSLLTFIKELYKIRTSHAVLFEKFMEETLKKHSKELTEKEIQFYLSKTKEFHRQEKLIK